MKYSGRMEWNELGRAELFIALKNRSVLKSSFPLISSLQPLPQQVNS